MGSRCSQIPIGIKFFTTKQFSKTKKNFLMRQHLKCKSLYKIQDLRRRFLRPLKRVNLTVLYSFYFLETCKSHRVIHYSTLWPKQTCFLGSRCSQIPIGIKFFTTKQFSKTKKKLHDAAASKIKIPIQNPGFEATTLTTPEKSKSHRVIEFLLFGSV